MSKTSKINFSLPVTILKEDGAFIAYSPAIDVSTVGESFEEAQNRFKEMAEIFFEELIEKGTLEKALTELGWRRKNKNLKPPVVVCN
jgi:predicted RNase H-like HicB family nuclease